ncbi:MAG: glycosyltransferase [Gammaproteobacteria bacterium]
MRILLTVHQFLPHYTSGTEILTLTSARELIARGHAVGILTAHPNTESLADDQRFEEYEFEGIPIFRFHHDYAPMGGQTSLLKLSYDNRLAASYFKKILFRFKPDIVHFFHLNRLGTGLIDESVAAGVPAYLTPTDFWAICNTAQLVLYDGRHCDGPSLHAGNCIRHLAQLRTGGLLASAANRIPECCLNGLGYLAQRRLLPDKSYGLELTALSERLKINVTRLNRLNGIVAPNRMMAERLAQHGVDPDLIVEKSYGIELGGQSGQPRTAGRQPLRIGYIGTLAWHKGGHVLVEAFNSLPKGQAVLIVYGNPNDFPDYSARLRTLADQRRDIEFRGVFANDRIFDVLADLDVLVVPSLWHENTPLVVYSAQAARCPIIASDCPGLAAVIEDELNGLLFPAGDIQALAQRLSRLIDQAELVGDLSTRSRPPKSAAAYVDDLLSIWNAA